MRFLILTTIVLTLLWSNPLLGEEPTMERMFQLEVRAINAEFQALELQRRLLLQEKAELEERIAAWQAEQAKVESESLKPAEPKESSDDGSGEGTTKVP